MSRLFIGTLLLTLVSCSPKSPTLLTQTKLSSIMNGRAVAPTDAVAKHVVAVYDTRVGGLCTGTLIDTNIVITAAHCAPKKASHAKIIFSDSIDYILTSLEPDVKQERMLTVVDFKIGPKWNPNNEADFDIGDIAIFKFKGQLPAGYSPVKMIADKSELNIGTSVTLAGFGVDTIITKKIDPKTYPNLEEAIAYGEVVCEENGECVSVESEGDGMLRMTEAPISEFKETEVILDEKKAGTCSGDSGGPAFIQKNGELFLFGVTSRGGALCNDIGVYTNVLSYTQFITETVKRFKL
jgi:secreted trypsin-like serine protease